MGKIICKHCGHENKPTLKYCYRCGFELPKVEAKVINEEKGTKKNVDKKKLIGGIVGSAMFAVFFFLAQQLFTPSFDKIMVKTASEINKTCPFMVDEYTRLDNTVAMPNNTFQYNYTLVDIAKEEINLDTVRKYIEPSLINNVKTNPDLKVFRDNKTTLSYYYKDKNGEFVHKFLVTPDLYGPQTE